MTGITGLGRTAAAAGAYAPSRTATAGGGGAFRVSERTEGQAVSAAGSAGGLTGLLAMQEAGTAELRDREARRHGRAMLQGLAALQRALLAGQDDPETLHELGQLAARETDAADPALLAVVRATRLRAQVELARRGL